MGASGYPPLTYIWTKDGQYVRFGGRVTLDPKTGSITFKPVQKIDKGNYTCEVVSTKLGGHTFDPISAVVIGKVHCEAFAPRENTDHDTGPQYHQRSSTILIIKSQLKAREKLSIFVSSAVHQLIGV